jgi:hypothetical protein
MYSYTTIDVCRLIASRDVSVVVLGTDPFISSCPHKNVIHGDSSRPRFKPRG